MNEKRCWENGWNLLKIPENDKFKKKVRENLKFAKKGWKNFKFHKTLRGIFYK